MKKPVEKATDNALVAKISLPRFDAEVTADLVIRIIEQFRPKAAGRYSTAAVTGSSFDAKAPTSGEGILVFLSGQLY